MGVRQWGLAMQEDVTDATRWAVDRGIADAQGNCLYGASYAAYSALMGAAREPGLYRCAAGYVGVYDLEMMPAESVRYARWAGKGARDWVGDGPQALRAASPVHLAGQITLPVFLAAGGEEATAPVGHIEAMEAALRKARTSVSSLYYRHDGHGFSLPENQRAYCRASCWLSCPRIWEAPTLRPERPVGSAPRCADTTTAPQGAVVVGTGIAQVSRGSGA